MTLWSLTRSFSSLSKIRINQKRLIEIISNQVYENLHEGRNSFTTVAKIDWAEYVWNFLEMHTSETAPLKSVTEDPM